MVGLRPPNRVAVPFPRQWTPGASRACQCLRSCRRLRKSDAHAAGRGSSSTASGRSPPRALTVPIDGAYSPGSRR